MPSSAAAAILLHLAVAAATGVAYALARPPRPDRLAGYRGPIAVLGGWAHFVTGPILEGAQALGVSANAISGLGLLLSLAAAAEAATGAWGGAGLLLLWGSACDLLDGELARRTGTGSPAGAFLDSNLDRISELALFSALVVAFPDRAGQGWALLALGASVMVSYARARGEGLGVACPTFGLERPHRLLLVLAALLVAAFLPVDEALVVVEGSCAAVGVGAGATALGRLAVIHGILRRAADDAAGPSADPTRRGPA
jgi:CDP-diacylglycerol--glycerol-3-phosphate 3-phosphatidyltransferase